MLPRQLLGTANVPGSTTQLRCFRHDADYSIWADRTELMSSRVHESEQRLAELALAGVQHRTDLRVLIGGLGMGFTAARALALTAPAAHIDVVEIVPEVVEWNRSVFGHCAGHPLRDARCHVILDDVANVIATAPDRYDAVILDVDNGPEGLARPGNDGLYDERGITMAQRALRRGGTLSVWSSAPAPAFAARLRRTGLAVAEHTVRARGTKGPKRTIWVARRDT